MKEQVVTFKADKRMSEQLKNIPNKSEFIRNAVFKALNNVCPVCNGVGVLNSCQQDHWQDFTAHHAVERCDDCQSVHLACEHN
ncbi:CopG family transcriptional regulator [Reinekea thalattae]|uniref:CopG family transcriptional regulator n=1 Tax=Reinekea thalattae TaxID=2593301 RepID=A0A5C8Z841_9GAMM|nr:CopG family transcriptional regulator [Reinekea thalattae]TXR53489.1 CopG family transcriptional regulator [Reinekea thalattae]